MYNNTMLMCGDTEVLEFNFKERLYLVKCQKLLPFGLKGKVFTAVKPATRDNNLLNKYDDLISDNKDNLQHWLSSRALSLSRQNAKKLYNALRIEQVY